MNPSTEQIAYLAGFFDGEGCVSIGQHSIYKGKKYFRLAVSVFQVKPKPLDLLRIYFGGSVRGPIHYAGSRQKPYYRYFTQGATAANLLRAIYPYCHVKREQIEIALAFHEKELGGNFAYETMKLLNRRGYVEQ